MVRQLASRPSALVDPYALVAALEQLAGVSRETNHPERSPVSLLRLFGLLEEGVEPQCWEGVFNAGRQDILLGIVLI